MQKKYYYSFKDHLTERFGERVHRIPIDAGFSCPNRDGTKARGGCIYCDIRGSGAGWLKSDFSVKDQLVLGMESMRNRFRTNKFIAYFQAFSNTYGTIDRLRSLYNEALSVPNIVGLSIGTRPDCVPNPVLDMIGGIAAGNYIWIEYGLQSIHQASLDWMNRAHSYEEFTDAVYRTQGRNILIAAHIILGLPGETKEDMYATVDALSELPIDGVKIHHLYIPTESPIERLYRAGKISVFEQDEYVELVADVIERLPRKMVIHRVMGDADRKHLVAPLWALRKADILYKLECEFERRGTSQGDAYLKRRVLPQSLIF